LVSEEKLRGLLALGAEYAELDFKRKIDLTRTDDTVKLAKHVGAMQVVGVYIVIGADDSGTVTDDMEGVNTSPFDQASLQSKMLQFLERPLNILSRVMTVPDDEGVPRTVVIISIGANPRGCAFFRADGNIEGRNSPLFKAGDVFWRDGTSSVRLSAEGLERVVEQRVAIERQAWIEEQAEIRRAELEALQAAARGREASEGPLGTVTVDLPAEELSLAALDLIRRGDDIAVAHLFREVRARATAAIDHGDLDGSLVQVLDQLVSLASTFMTYSQESWFSRAIDVFVQIYEYPATPENIRSFGYSTSIDPNEPAPQVWLKIIERISALGGLAVRTENWSYVRTLTLQLPRLLAQNEYDHNWLRHGLTMASRATHFEREGQELNLVFMALELAKESPSLRSDGIDPESDELLTSIATFDFLYNVIAASNAGDAFSPGATFYPSFSQLYQSRIQTIADRLVREEQLQGVLLEDDVPGLAGALEIVGEYATTQGWRYDGFHGWSETPVGEWLRRRELDD
jgi:hypothetical protein